MKRRRPTSRAGVAISEARMADASKPQGPYTVWVDYGSEGWNPTDFDSLQTALEWDRSGCSRYVITKPVQYRVQEISEPRAPLRALPPGLDAEDLSGPPADPDNPDSGKARYV